MKTKIFNPKTEIFSSSLKKVVLLCFDEEKYNFSTIVDGKCSNKDAIKFFIGSKHQFDKELTCTAIRIFIQPNRNLINDISDFLGKANTDWQHNMLYIKNEVIHCNNGVTSKYYNLKDLTLDQTKEMNDKIVPIAYLMRMIENDGIEFTAFGVCELRNKKVGLSSISIGEIGKKNKLYCIGECTGKREYIGSAPFEYLKGDKINRPLRKRFKLVKTK